MIFNNLPHLTVAVPVRSCMDCKYGSEREGSSFCEKESCYSYLSGCVREKALSEFLAVHGG